MGKIEDVVRNDAHKNIEIEEWAQQNGIEEEELIAFLFAMAERYSAYRKEMTDKEALVSVLGACFHIGYEAALLGLEEPV